MHVRKIIKMHYKTCEICGVRSGRNKNEKRLFMAKFPLDEARCKQWVKFVGKQDLAFVPIEKLHMLKHVCGKHFKTTDFKTKKTQLQKSAIPSMCLTNQPLTDDILADFPLHVANCEMVTDLYVDLNSKLFREHNYCKPPVSTSKRQHSPDAIPTFTEETTLMDESQCSIESLEGNTGPTVDNTEPIEEYAPPIEENTFSWQKPEEVVTIPEDDVQMEDIPEDMSMYVEEDDPTSPPHDHDTTSKDCITHLDKATPHEAFWCNVCSAPITGFRYTCVQCSDLDLCGACEADTQHSQHYVLRVPALRPITEVQSVLATIRRHLMHKLDPINEPEQDCGDAVSVKSEVKSEEDSDDDAPENKSDDDVSVGSRTSSQASEYEYLDDDIYTDCIEEIVISQPDTDESCGSARETSSETKTTRKREMTIHTSDAPERDKECLPSILNKRARLMVQLTDVMKSNNKLSAQNTKDTIQTSDLQQPKALRPKGNEASEQSQTFKQPKSNVIIIDGTEFNVPGCSVRVMKVPLKSQQYVGRNRAAKKRPTKDDERNNPHENNR